MTSDPRPKHTELKNPAVQVAAASACWLARLPGLPKAYGLRHLVTTRHPGPCRFCATDADALLAGITRWLAANDPECRFDADGQLRDLPVHQAVAA